ncbi:MULTISPECIES: EamA family transporter [Pseudomonas]|jgi:drug/metabolite transporter (DMT)-like permease|uniref:DMT family transporter n=2 Tax=Pseudomonas TaxID=286 RepID=A0A4Y9TFC8_PSEFL|nr:MULTISPECIES: DMT family transporter [Pseudomonas]CRM94218.1 carboxylate/amino acid/amine transporter [Pseudomonas sp. 22 E 5]MCX9150632.1 DMT family transporter [Pseudomonas sp. TB1-B1]QXH65094.1 DMT family transporter [Pseudomonas asgharzadehiana]TFW41086.1 DMT family transporter [Pseudomonas fluorescens]TKJ62259.1 EamA/RhaT family transporter [Pseudomonas sp. CFBP13506]
MTPPAPALFSRPIAVLILLCMGCAFAGNHVAARVAFDDGAGVLLAILLRSGGTLLVLAGWVLWQRQSLRLPPGAWRWQVLLGLLIATQSLCLYSAVARIPVALALLVANVFPMLLALLTWALGGPRPTARTALLMGLILVGLVFVLDVPGRLSSEAGNGPQWLVGVALAFCAAWVFACALWITDHKLSQVRGSVRSLLTIFIVFASVNFAGLSGALPGGLDTPATATGWLALATLVVLYGTAFIVLFMSVPRLDMPRNAPVMNIEPLATLLMGWIVLDQLLSVGQMLGGVIVVTAIVLLTYRTSPRPPVKAQVLPGSSPSGRC